MPRRLWVVLSVLALVGPLGCDRHTSHDEPAPTTTLAPPATTAIPDTKALESAPASTDPLVDVVAPATIPLPGLDGTPDSSPAAGRLDAPVRVTIFSDYQCPVCRRALEPLKLSRLQTRAAAAKDAAASCPAGNRRRRQ